MTETTIGTPVQAYENRTAAFCPSYDGNHYLVICAKDCVISVCLERRSSTQVFYPDGEANYAYSSLPSSKGMVYTGSGKRFLEFDPVRGEFLHSCPVATADCAAYSLTEGAQGEIYFSNYPDCTLYRFLPERGTCERIIRFDETEKYPQNMVFDLAGWVYIGVGTERSAIHGYNLRTGDLRTFAAAERTKGGGLVFLGSDGTIYGLLNRSRDIPAKQAVILHDGEARPVEESAVLSRFKPCGIFDALFTVPGRENFIEGFSLEDRTATYRHPVSGETVRLALEYRNEGTSLSPLAAGPDGRIYGGSNHPFHFYVYTPAGNGFRHIAGGNFLVGKPNHTIGTEPGDRICGNVCAYAWVGGVMYGAMYSGGYLVRLDPDAPIEPGVNPRNVATHEEIHRPRCLLALPDRRRVVYGGFGGYGDHGGALCFYDTGNGTETLVENRNLVPHHSVFCLDNLDARRMIAGTSTFTPGGARQQEKDAVLFLFDTETMGIERRLVPAEGSEQVTVCLVDGEGMAHGVTNRSIYFVCDPARGQIVHREDCGRFGAPVQMGGVRDAAGELHVLFEKAVTRVDTGARRLVEIHAPRQPITMGGAALDGRIYFGCRHELHSCG